MIILPEKINENEPLFYSLTNIYGIGYSQSWEICKDNGFIERCNFFFFKFKKRKS